MIQLIKPEYYGALIDDLAEMHRLRYRVFKRRLDWTVQVSGDMEVDEFTSFGQSICCIAQRVGKFRGALGFCFDWTDNAKGHVPYSS